MKLTKFATLLAMTAALAGCSSMDSSEIGSSNVQLADVVDQGTLDGSYSASKGVTLPNATGEELRQKLISTAGNDRVFFDFDSASLNAEAQAYLRQAAEYINANGVSSLTVEGHCDERGTREYNLALGDRRAVSVKRFLVGLGVDPHKIVTISYGKERPAENGHVEAVWAKNRRSVLVFN